MSLDKPSGKLDTLSSPKIRQEIVEFSSNPDLIFSLGSGNERRNSERAVIAGEFARKHPGAVLSSSGTSKGFSERGTTEAQAQAEIWRQMGLGKRESILDHEARSTYSNISKMFPHIARMGTAKGKIRVLLVSNTESHCKRAARRLQEAKQRYDKKGKAPFQLEIAYFHPGMRPQRTPKTRPAVQEVPRKSEDQQQSVAPVQDEALEENPRYSEKAFEFSQRFIKEHIPLDYLDRASKEMGVLDSNETINEDFLHDHTKLTTLVNKLQEHLVGQEIIEEKLADSLHLLEDGMLGPVTFQAIKLKVTMGENTGQRTALGESMDISKPQPKPKPAPKTKAKEELVSADFYVKKHPRKGTKERPYEYFQRDIETSRGKLQISTSGRLGVTVSAKSEVEGNLSLAINQTRELKKRGIQTVVSLTAHETTRAAAKEVGLEYYRGHMPSSFSSKAVKLFNKIAGYLKEGKSIHIHCRYGTHRAKTALAGGLIAAGYAKSIGEAFKLAGLNYGSFRNQSSYIVSLIKYARSKNIEIESPEKLKSQYGITGSGLSYYKRSYETVV